ncbi:hypothetical protein [Burkholderia gladioli]|uniref:hypothetical protein n=1 Tax=Burkholderia gladioli TaxID=28095 RepID=UPI0002E5A623|nr:hypothetical protein [Burkholderia gladioli]
MSIELHHNKRAPFCWAGSTGPIKECPLHGLRQQLARASTLAAQRAIQDQIEATMQACDEKFDVTVDVTIEADTLQTTIQPKPVKPSGSKNGRI